MNLRHGWYSVFFAILAVGQPTLAANQDLEARLDDCAAIVPTAKRLMCFDTLVKSLDVARRNTGQARSDWIVSSRVSPMDDRTNVYLLLRSKELVETKFFGKVRPKLWFQCVRGETKAILEWGFIVGGGVETVTYRLDQDQLKTAVVKVSDDFSSLVSWDKERVTRFIKSLFGKKRLFIEIKPFSDPPIMATFNITGIETAIAPLRAACSW